MQSLLAIPSFSVYWIQVWKEPFWGTAATFWVVLGLLKTIA